MTERKWGLYSEKVAKKRPKVHITSEEIKAGVDRFLADGGTIKRDIIVQKVIDGEKISYEQDFTPFISYEFIEACDLISGKVEAAPKITHHNLITPSQKLKKKFQNHTDNAILTEDELAELVGIPICHIIKLREGEIGRGKINFINIAGKFYCKFGKVKTIKMKLGAIIGHEKRLKKYTEQGLISERKAAEYLGMSLSGLSNSRRGRNKVKSPPHVTIGRYIYYQKSDLQSFKKGKK